MIEPARNPETPTDLPFFLTSSDVGNLLRSDEFVRPGLPDDRRRRQIGAAARRWLKAHAVPCVRVGKHKIFRREAVLDALADAERQGGRS